MTRKHFEIVAAAISNIVNRPDRWLVANMLADSFEKDKALMRRFARLDIEETDVDSTKEIIRGLKPYYEEFHGVTYDNDLLDKSVDLCDRYIKNKCFPDKALDIVDAAGATVKLREDQTVTIEDIISVVSKVSKIGSDVIDTESVDTFKTLDLSLIHI